MKRVRKVVAYIVRDGRVAVFVHGDHDRLDLAGVQVPAGTAKDGELPEAHVLAFGQGSHLARLLD